MYVPPFDDVLLSQRPAGIQQPATLLVDLRLDCGQAVDYIVEGHSAIHFV